MFTSPDPETRHHSLENSSAAASSYTFFFPPADRGKSSDFADSSGAENNSHTFPWQQTTLQKGARRLRMQFNRWVRERNEEEETRILIPCAGYRSIANAVSMIAYANSFPMRRETGKEIACVIVYGKDGNMRGPNKNAMQFQLFAV